MGDTPEAVVAGTVHGVPDDVRLLAPAQQHAAPPHVEFLQLCRVGDAPEAVVDGTVHIIVGVSFQNKNKQANFSFSCLDWFRISFRSEVVTSMPAASVGVSFRNKIKYLT